MSEDIQWPPYCPMCGAKLDFSDVKCVEQHKQCIDWGIFMKVYLGTECWKKASINNGIRVAEALYGHSK